MIKRLFEQYVRSVCYRLLFSKIKKRDNCILIIVKYIIESNDIIYYI